MYVYTYIHTQYTYTDIHAHIHTHIRTYIHTYILCCHYAKRKHFIWPNICLDIRNNKEIIQAGKQMIMNALNHLQIHLINEVSVETSDTDSSIRRNEETYINFLALVTPLIQEISLDCERE